MTLFNVPAFGDLLLSQAPSLVKNWRQLLKLLNKTDTSPGWRRQDALTPEGVILHTAWEEDFYNPGTYLVRVCRALREHDLDGGYLEGRFQPMPRAVLLGSRKYAVVVTVKGLQEIYRAPYFDTEGTQALATRLDDWFIRQTRVMTLELSEEKDLERLHGWLVLACATVPTPVQIDSKNLHKIFVAQLGGQAVLPTTVSEFKQLLMSPRSAEASILNDYAPLTPETRMKLVLDLDKWSQRLTPTRPVLSSILVFTEPNLPGWKLKQPDAVDPAKSKTCVTRTDALAYANCLTEVPMGFGGQNTRLTTSFCVPSKSKKHAGLPSSNPGGLITPANVETVLAVMTVRWLLQDVPATEANFPPLAPTDLDGDAWLLFRRNAVVYALFHPKNEIYSLKLNEVSLPNHLFWLSAEQMIRISKRVEPDVRQRMQEPPPVMAGWLAERWKQLLPEAREVVWQAVRWMVESAGWRHLARDLQEGCPIQYHRWDAGWDACFYELVKACNRGAKAEEKKEGALWKLPPLDDNAVTVRDDFLEAQRKLGEKLFKQLPELGIWEESIVTT